MTKDEFITGKPFNSLNNPNRPYMFKKGSLEGVLGSVFYLGDYQCNVDKVTEKFAYCYVSVVGKCVTIRLELSKLHS